MDSLQTECEKPVLILIPNLMFIKCFLTSHDASLSRYVKIAVVAVRLSVLLIQVDFLEILEKGN